jgi:hypothetical protein
MGDLGLYDLQAFIIPTPESTANRSVDWPVAFLQARRTRK